MSFRESFFGWKNNAKFVTLTNTDGDEKIGKISSSGW